MQDRTCNVRHIVNVREFSGRAIYQLTLKDKNTLDNDIISNSNSLNLLKYIVQD
jgi:hypothetical protein